MSEPQNTDLTTEEESRKPKNIRRKRAVPSEWKRNDTKLLRNAGHENRTVKRGTEIPEWKVLPPCGAACTMKCVSEFSEQDRLGIFKRFWSLGDIDARRILSWNELMSHQARLEILLSCFRMRNKKKKLILMIIFTLLEEIVMIFSP